MLLGFLIACGPCNKRPATGGEAQRRRCACDARGALAVVAAAGIFWRHFLLLFVFSFNESMFWVHHLMNLNVTSFGPSVTSW